MAKRGIQGAIMRTMQLRDHTVTVVSKERLAPHFVRVHLRSDTLYEQVELAPTAWVRGWFPDAGGRDTEHQRGYTISSGAAAAGELSIDFVLHQPAGPASAWAERCAPGDTLQMNTLGSSKFELPEERPAGYLLVGDSAAIPGLAGIIEALPPEVPIELYLEQHDADDPLIPLPEHPGMRVHWAPRTGAGSLAAAIEARDWSDWYVWATPESASLKQLRTRLRDDFGFPRSEIHSQAYWIEGKAMGKQRGEAAESGEAADPAAPGIAGSEAAPARSASRAAESAEPTEPATSAEPAAPSPAVEATTAPVRGEWKAAAGSRLLRELKPVFIATAALQAIVTLIELAPFFLLVELSRRLLAGANSAGTNGTGTGAGPDPGGLWAIGLWAVALVGLGALLGAALLLWLHAVDARFERGLRARLLHKLSRLPLGWFQARGSGQVKQLVQDDTLALHYLVTHAVADAAAAVVAPVAVLAYLFAVDWVLALVMFVPVLFYVITMYVMILRSYDTIPKALKWAERM